jgi:large subunit ribosomal protein L32
MAVPKRRTSKSKQGHRRSHHHLKVSGVQYCKRCNEPTMPHRVCSNCGFYQGRDAIVVKAGDTEGN